MASDKLKIESQRLILRSYTEDDGEDLYEYLSDADVVKYEPYPPFSKDQAYEEAENRAENPCFIAVCIKSTGKLIGNLYYNKVEPKKVNTYEIGYVFNKSFQGMGYATEAAKCLLEYLFNVQNAHRAIAYCNTENEPSWKLLERLKFRREATRLQNMFFDTDADGNPLWFDSYQYAILQSEYKK